MNRTRRTNRCPLRNDRSLIRHESFHLGCNFLRQKTAGRRKIRLHDILRHRD